MTQAWPLLRRYRNQELAQIKMPVGGIGTGCISFGGRGQLIDWELANQPAKGHTPDHSFFALHLEGPDGLKQTRVLERSLLDHEFVGPHGSPSPNHGLPRFRSGSFSAAYPLGQVDLSDPDLPVSVTVQCFNPLIPQDADASGIPALIYRVHLTNTSQTPLVASIAGNLTNFIGYQRETPLPSGNSFAQIDRPASTTLLGSSTEVPADHEAFGTLAISTLDGPASSSRLNWESRSWSDSLLDFWDDFDADSQLEPPSKGATVPTASLVASRSVEPGQTQTFTFAITWHFPNRYEWGHSRHQAAALVGNHYTTVFSDAADVAEQLINRLPELEARTLEFVRSITDSDLPVAIQDAALSNLAVLKSPTCFRIADGTFLGWEGCNDHTGSCHGSCTHVWNYQYALEALFGDLAWSMREVEFLHSLDSRGMMSFRAGLPLESEGTSWPTAAADGQMGAIVRFHRTWKLTGQYERMAALWPDVRRAMEFAWIENGWDADRDGVMEGCQHNTMDVEYYGPSGVNQSWYLAALAACVELAHAVGQQDFASTCQQLLDVGSSWTDENLFNGEYYQQKIIPAGSADRIAPGLRIRYEGENPWVGSDDLTDPDMQIGSGCTADQLVGHSMATIGGLNTQLDPDHLSAALKSIMTYNWRDDFFAHFNHMRSYALGDEQGLLVCSFPHGNRPARPFPYCNEVWTGLEYSAAIQLALSGDRSGAEKVVAAVRRRYDGRRRNPFNEVECGHHYVRSMAAWGLVEAWHAGSSKGN